MILHDIHVMSYVNRTFCFALIEGRAAMRIIGKIPHQGPLSSNWILVDVVQLLFEHGTTKAPWNITGGFKDLVFLTFNTFVDVSLVVPKSQESDGYYVA